MALSSSQGSKSPSVSQGKNWIEVGAYTGKDRFQSHQKRKPMKVVANLIWTKMLLSGCSQSQAAGVSSKGSILFMCRLPFQTNMLGKEKVKDRPTRLLRVPDSQRSCSYKNWKKVLFLSVGDMVKVRWTGSQNFGLLFGLYLKLSSTHWAI